MVRGGPVLFRGGPAMFRGGPAMFQGGPASNKRQKSYGWVAQPAIWWGGVVAHKILVSAPVPLELIWTGFDWVGAGPWGFGIWDGA